MFDAKHDHQFQYSFAHRKIIVDRTLNATEDKLFAVDRVCILVYTPQGQFLHSIAVDPAHCGLFITSICTIPDGHLLIGSIALSTLCYSYNPG